MFSTPHPSRTPRGFSDGLPTNALMLPGGPLHAEDYEALAKSAIPREIADAACLRRLAHLDASSIYGRKHDCTGIYFPNVWPGEPGNLRPSRLRLDTSHGKQRYLAEREGGNHLYICPGTPAAWLADAALPLVLTEGEKKTLSLVALAQHDVDTPRWLVIGISGVHSWRDNRKKEITANGDRVSVSTVIADLDRVRWQGRTVIIIFDRNVATNRAVRMAREGLRCELVSRGALVEYVDLPADIEGGINGIDDLHFQWGADKTLAYIAAARNRKRPACWDCFQIQGDGVYYVEADPDKQPLRLCGPLEIAAQTRSAASEGWGRLLRWQDDDGKAHQWAMPVCLLAGMGEEYRRRLMDGGLYINPKTQAREKLALYLQTQGPGVRVQCVDRIGWHEDTFVLPDVSLRPAGAEQIVYQTEDPRHHMHVAGSVDEWREHVAALCAGNSRLVLAVACAFAGALLHPLGGESGGLHLVGPSSSGKSTALVVAGSVLGGGDEGFVSTWRATTNGLEAVAEAHNDLTLILDELGQVDPREAADAAYLLANGLGKIRMTRTISLRRRPGWRLLFLSAGELTLADHSASAGKRTRGGAEVRLLNIGADAGAGMGLFQDLHDCASSDAFADLLKERALKYYGAPGRVFLENVVKRRAEILKRWPEYRTAFVGEHIPKDASGEVRRAAGRLALIAYAGEMATQWRITGWAEDEARRAAGSALLNWVETHGGAVVRADDEAAIRKVRLFVEMHGASRFESAKFTDRRTNDVIQERIPNRAGFRSEDDKGEFDYWILPEVFRTEVCAGQDYRVVARALDRAGHLDREHPALTKKPYIGALGMDLRVFAVKSSILES